MFFARIFAVFALLDLTRSVALVEYEPLKRFLLSAGLTTADVDLYGLSVGPVCPVSNSLFSCNDAGRLTAL